MKRNNRGAVEVANGESHADSPNNCNSVLMADPRPDDLSIILAGLQTMRDGDFSVRLPGSWTGLAGKSPTHSTPLSLPISRWRRN